MTIMGNSCIYGFRVNHLVWVDCWHTYKRAGWDDCKVLFSINIMKVGIITKLVGGISRRLRSGLHFFHTGSIWIVKAHFIVYLLCAKHWRKYCMCIISFTLHGQVNWDKRKRLPKLTELKSGRAGQLIAL